MSTPVELLSPGIAELFEPFGYGTHVTDIDGQCSITLTRRSDGLAETRLFPWPATNRDLSTPLLLWRAALLGPKV